jgi:hypothetical protein
MRIKGTDIRFSCDGDYVNCETSCVLNVNREVVGKSSAISGQARYYRPSYYDWTMEVSAYTILSSFNGSFNSLLGKMIIGDEIGVQMSVVMDNETIIRIYGQAIPTNFTLNAGTGNADYNVTFRGTGDLGREFELFWQIINAQPYNADKPNVIDTTI